MALTIDELNIQITADSEAATSAVDGLIGGLQRLKKTLNTFGGAGKKINKSLSGIESAAKKSNSALSMFGFSATSAGKSTKDLTYRLAQNISKWRTLLSVARNAANTMSELFTESNDYIETLNLFNVTMGEGADAAYKYAESVQKLMGVDIAEWMNYQGTFKNLTSGFGVVEKDANTMSQNLTQLSYDMASFFNTDVETAFDKLSSAMAGQVKGLRDFGIDVTVASLQEYALAKGIDKTVRSMTMAEKSMLRYNYIMEKSILMQGDMARTIVTPSNALRILNAQLTQMKRALGNVVSVIVARFIPYVQAMVEIITEAANALANRLGFTLPKIDYSGLGSGFSDEMEDAESSLEGASDTIKTIKKQLMGFDELNILSSPNADGGSGGADDGGGVLDMKPLEYDFLSGLKTDKLDEVKNTLKKILGYVPIIGAGFAAWKAASLIADLLRANKIISGWQSLGITAGVTLSVVGLVWNIKASIDAWKNGLEIPNFTEILASSGITVAGGTLTGAAIGQSLSAALIGGAVAGIAMGAGMIITAIHDALMNGLNTLNATLMIVGTTLLGASIGALIGGPMGALIGAVFGAQMGVWANYMLFLWEKKEEILAIFEPIAQWVYDTIFKPIFDFISKVKIWVNEEIVVPFGEAIKKIKDYAVSKYTEIKDGIVLAISVIKAKLVEIGGKFKEIAVAIKYIFKTHVADPIKTAFDKFKEKYITPIATAFKEMWNEIKQKVFDKIYEKFTSIRDKAVSVFEDVGITVVDFTSNLFKTVINSLFGFIENRINGFIYLLNDAIDILNKVPGVDITTVEPISIPRLAEGGVVSAGQMFIAREAGPELVGNIGRKTAVANNDQIINGIYNGVYRAMMAANGGSGKAVTVNATFELDGEVVGRKVIKYHNGVVMQTGESPLLV